MTGLLPGEARQVNYSPCALHIYVSMEGCLSIYRQENQKEGKYETSFVLLTVSNCCYQPGLMGVLIRLTVLAALNFVP